MKQHPTTWGRDNLHLGKLALFAVLSVADLFMTWQLVQASDGKVYESNPVANAWLVSFGWVGLTIFKILAMLLVVLAALYVARHRPRTGGRILIFACAATALVVVYSCYLGLRADSNNLVGNEEASSAEHKSYLLDREMTRQKHYQALLAQLGGELVARRITLGEAVNRLAQTDKARNAQWLTVLHRTYPGRSDTECLAIHLIHHTLALVNHDPSVRNRLASQLETEYQTTFGSEVTLDLIVQTRDPEPLAVHQAVASPPTTVMKFSQVFKPTAEVP